MTTSRSKVKTPTAAQFRERFPEFTVASHPDAAITQAAETASRISAVSFEALLYLTAHVRTLDAENTAALDGGSGEVTAESVETRNVTYAKQAKDEGDVFFTRSSYGRMFKMLENRTPSRAMGIAVFE